MGEIEPELAAVALIFLVLFIAWARGTGNRRRKDQ